MDISDIYRNLPRRYIETLDKLADSYLPDIPPTGNRLADAVERIADHMGATVHETGDRTLDALDAIVNVMLNGKEYNLGSLSDISDMMSGDEEKFVLNLSEDIEAGAVEGAINIPEGKKVILDLGGHTITGQNVLVQVDGGEAVIKGGTLNSVGRSVRVQNGGKLTIEDAEIISTRSNAVNVCGGGTAVLESGNVKAQEFGVLVTEGSEFIMNGGVVEGIDNCVVGGNGSNGKGDITITINGGTLIGHIQSSGYIACGIYHPNSGTINVNGGEIISDGCGICMRGGTVNLNGGKITAKGKSGVVGKVGDSPVVVGPYAVIYDETAKYPASESMELNIAKGVVLRGTDGDLSVLVSGGVTANIIDNR